MGDKRCLYRLVMEVLGGQKAMRTVCDREKAKADEIRCEKARNGPQSSDECMSESRETFENLYVEALPDPTARLPDISQKKQTIAVYLPMFISS